MDDQILAHEYLSRLEFCKNSLADCQDTLEAMIDMRDFFQESLKTRELLVKSYSKSFPELVTGYNEFIEETRANLNSYQADVDIWTKHTSDWQRRVDDLLGKTLQIA